MANAPIQRSKNPINRSSFDQPHCIALKTHNKMQISNLLVGCRFGVALKALNIMLSMRLFDAVYKADGFEGIVEGVEDCGVRSTNQNSNCNWSLTSIIAFNYIYLFARRLLSSPLPCGPPFPPSLPVPCHSWWWWCRLCACAGQLATMSIGFALIRISFMHGIWPRLLFYFISFHSIWVFFHLSGNSRTSAQPALLWLSCFIQQLMRKLAVVWIIYNSTHVVESAAAGAALAVAVGSGDKQYASGV